MINYNVQQANQVPQNEKTLSFAITDGDNTLMWSNLLRGQDRMSQEDFTFFEDEVASLDGKLLGTTKSGVKLYLKVFAEGNKGEPGNLRAKYAK
jgi:hypothetical protein